MFVVPKLTAVRQANQRKCETLQSAKFLQLRPKNIYPRASSYCCERTKIATRSSIYIARRFASEFKMVRVEVRGLNLAVKKTAVQTFLKVSPAGEATLSKSLPLLALINIGCVVFFFIDRSGCILILIKSFARKRDRSTLRSRLAHENFTTPP